MSSYIGKININNTEYPIAQSLFGTCNTTANTATKVVTCADFDTLISGIVINVYFTYANTESSISLNVNSTGNKTVYIDSNSSILWDAGATKSFVYYNNQWRLINPTSVGTTYSAATTASDGLMSSSDKQRLNNVTNIQNYNGINISRGNSTTYYTASSTAAKFQIRQGDNIVLTPEVVSNNQGVTISATNTTYAAATTGTAGLMSASDKLKVDELDSKYVPIEANSGNLKSVINNQDGYILQIKSSTLQEETATAQAGLWIYNDEGNPAVGTFSQSSHGNSGIEITNNMPTIQLYSNKSGENYTNNILMDGSHGITLQTNSTNNDNYNLISLKYGTDGYDGIRMESKLGITIGSRTPYISIGTNTTSGVHITQVADPTNDEDAANKRYVDNAISGGILKGIRINSSDSYVSSLGSNVYLITHNQGFAENFTSTVMVKNSSSSYFYQAINDDGVSLAYTSGKIRYDIFDIQENQFKIEFSSVPYQFSILINTNYDSLSLVDVDSTQTLLNI